MKRDVGWKKREVGTLWQPSPRGIIKGNSFPVASFSVSHLNDGRAKVLGRQPSPIRSILMNKLLLLAEEEMRRAVSRGKSFESNEGRRPALHSLVLPPCLVNHPLFWPSWLPNARALHLLLRGLKETRDGRQAGGRVNNKRDPSTDKGLWVDRVYIYHH